MLGFFDGVGQDTFFHWFEQIIIHFKVVHAAYYIKVIIGRDYDDFSIAVFFFRYSITCLPFGNGILMSTKIISI